MQMYLTDQLIPNYSLDINLNIHVHKSCFETAFCKQEKLLLFSVQEPWCLALFRSFDVADLLMSYVSIVKSFSMTTSTNHFIICLNHSLYSFVLKQLRNRMAGLFPSLECILFFSLHWMWKIIHCINVSMMSSMHAEAANNLLWCPKLQNCMLHATL